MNADTFEALQVSGFDVKHATVLATINLDLKPLAGRTACKVGELVQVDPAYILQTCAVCQHVDKENRKTQAVFRCTAYRHTANAAVNILVRGCPWTRPARGAGTPAQRGAFPLGTSTIREPSRRGPPAQPRPKCQALEISPNHPHANGGGL